MYVFQEVELLMVSALVDENFIPTTDNEKYESVILILSVG